MTEIKTKKLYGYACHKCRGAHIRMIGGRIMHVCSGDLIPIYVNT